MADYAADRTFSVVLSLGASGEKLASVEVHPAELVASLRRAAISAAPQTLLSKFGRACGVRLVFNERLLADGDSVAVAGLSDGIEVGVIFTDGLDAWEDAHLQWREIEIPLIANFDGPSVAEVGRDRLLVYGLPCADEGKWQVEPSAHDIWLVGTDEMSKAWAPEEEEEVSSLTVNPLGGSYFGRCQVPLPVPKEAMVRWSPFQDGTLAVLFDAEDTEADDGAEVNGANDGKAGISGKPFVLRRFRLLNAMDPNMSAAYFVEEGMPETMRASLPADEYFGNRLVSRDLRKPVFGTQAPPKLACGDLICFGEIVNRKTLNVEEQAFDDGDDSCEPKSSDCVSAGRFWIKKAGEEENLAAFCAFGRGFVQALGRNFCLMGSKHVGEDESILEYMRLMDWRTGKFVRRIDVECGFFQHEENWGLLPGSSQSFYHVRAKDRSDSGVGCIVGFCSPVAA